MALPKFAKPHGGHFVISRRLMFDSCFISSRYSVELYTPDIRVKLQVEYALFSFRNLVDSNRYTLCAVHTT